MPTASCRRLIAAAAVALVPIAAAADTSSLPDDLVRRSLILDIDSGELGLFRIEPRNPGPFQAFTRLDVAALENSVADPEQWVLDRVAAETATIAETALVMFDPDSPYAGARINDIDPTPESVHATLELVVERPYHFCDGPTETYNETGLIVEVDCSFWLGGTSSHLLVRLQQAGTSWYVIMARAQNSRRYRQLHTIADSIHF
jgi:hypothetical protein